MHNYVHVENNPYAQNDEQLLEKFRDLYNSLSPLPLRQPGRIAAFGWDIEYVSGPAVYANIQYQVLKRINDFYPEHEKPVILDLGANIGLSVLNYKRQFPFAQIMAFEPDPIFLPILRHNLERNGASDVNIVDAAAWIVDGESTWLCEGIDGSKLILDDTQTNQTVVVKTVDLARYLNQEIDLIKMDIEGAELEVIPHLKGKLGSVKNLSIECHLKPSTIKSFCKLLETLDGEGFSLSINSYSGWRDLIRSDEPVPDHYWQYLLVSAWRKNPPSHKPVWGIVPNIDITFPLELANLSSLLQKTNRSYLEIYEQYQESRNQLAQLGIKYEESQNQLAQLNIKYEETLRTNLELKQSFFKRFIKKVIGRFREL